MNDARDGEEGIRGVYANLLLVGFNSLEVVFDFCQQYPEQGPRLCARIVTSPAYAKRFLKVIAESIAQYENEIRRIEDE
jgi:Protein of unknown function (DUF3467)